LEEQKQNQNIFMKEENEVKGSKNLKKSFQRRLFHKEEKEKNLHYSIVVHNLTQNVRFLVLCVAEFKYIPLSNNGIIRTMP